MPISTKEFERVTGRKIEGIIEKFSNDCKKAYNSPDLGTIITDNKNLTSIKNEFAPNIKESILRMEYNLAVRYDTKDYFFLSLFDGFKNFVRTQIQAMYINTAMKKDPKGSSDSTTTKETNIKTDSNGYYIVTMPDTEVYRNMNRKLLAVFSEYATLIQCVDRYTQEQKLKNEVEKAYDQRREAMNKLRTDEISNIDKRFKDMGLDKNVFSDEDIINLYNNAYWARKGDVAQPLPSWYIPPQQQRYYYDGH